MSFGKHLTGKPCYLGTERLHPKPQASGVDWPVNPVEIQNCIAQQIPTFSELDMSKQFFNKLFACMGYGKEKENFCNKQKSLICCIAPIDLFYFTCNYHVSCLGKSKGILVEFISTELVSHFLIKLLGDITQKGFEKKKARLLASFKRGMLQIDFIMFEAFRFYVIQVYQTLDQLFTKSFVLHQNPDLTDSKTCAFQSWSTRLNVPRQE